MQLVLIAGGKGTRLSSRARNLPKSMIEIGGKPLIAHQLELARKHGIREILILAGYGADHIQEFVQDGSRWDVNVHYHRELRPLGTAGAVCDAFEKLHDRFLVMYGDTMLNVNLSCFVAAHPSDAAATLFLHPNAHPHDSDLVGVDDANRVTALHAYPHPPGSYFSNLVNAALYVFSKPALRPFVEHREKFPEQFDFGKHLFPALIARNAFLHGYRSREYIKDAGTPERLDEVCRDYDSGKVQSGSLETALPAIFLDRDGTINYDHGWLTSPEQVELLPGAAGAIRAINKSGYLAVLVTNQPVIARGECTEQRLREIHNKLEWLLGDSHAFLDAIYFCPHHPDSGFDGERPELKIRCLCRKPATGLFQSAVRDLHIDISRSWMIGDKSCDVEAAARFGIRSALVAKNQKALDTTITGEPSVRSVTLMDAVSHILNHDPERR